MFYVNIGGQATRDIANLLMHVLEAGTGPSKGLDIKGLCMLVLLYMSTSGMASL